MDDRCIQKKFEDLQNMLNEYRNKLDILREINISLNQKLLDAPRIAADAIDIYWDVFRKLSNKKFVNLEETIRDALAGKEEK